MTLEEFSKAIAMFRSTDPMTYENAYSWLQAENGKQYAEQIAELVRSEQDEKMLAKLVELLGDADLVEYVPLLVEELAHPCREVRMWAYTQLKTSDHALARSHARKYYFEHPQEDFYHGDELLGES